jgi:hypothetical protein
MNELTIQILAVSISQMALVFFKHINIRVIVKEQILKSMFYTSLIQASWLIGSAIGINAYLDNNWLIVFVYIISGVVGTYLNFKIKV